MQLQKLDGIIICNNRIVIQFDQPLESYKKKTKPNLTHKIYVLNLPIGSLQQQVNAEDQERILDMIFQNQLFGCMKQQVQQKLNCILMRKFVSGSAEFIQLKWSLVQGKPLCIYFKQIRAMKVMQKNLITSQIILGIQFNLKNIRVERRLCKVVVGIETMR
ncbi:unnamed protein product [Paramecium octaurelia]|uniref:Uncharacterized protein n=1 Tax=Paramecium octaurelia TaxID=43137 RepID=A0A8S1SBG3_PAROT|nr:unnamed protein product [Paramecium octaurelia]